MKERSTSCNTYSEQWNRLMQHLDDHEMHVLYMVAYDILKNKDDADDVFQEALINGALNCRKIKNEQKIFAWMYTIVRNEALAYYYKKNRGCRGLLARLSLSLTSSAESAEKQYFDHQKKERLQELVMHLQHPDNVIIVEHIVEGKKLKEIAKQYNMNYNTVRSRYQRILKELQQELEEDNDR